MDEVEIVASLHLSKCAVAKKGAVAAILQLSSPSIQPLTQNDPSKPLRPHCILTLEADRLAAQSHVGFVRAKSQRIPSVWSQTCAAKTKGQNEPTRLHRASPTTERTQSHNRTSSILRHPSGQNATTLMLQYIRTTGHLEICVTAARRTLYNVRFCVTRSPSVTVTV
jgi:hypothetical protein